MDDPLLRMSARSRRLLSRSLKTPRATLISLLERLRTAAEAVIVQHDSTRVGADHAGARKRVARFASTRAMA